MDFVDLFRLGKGGSKNGDEAARVAVLGFCTTQYYTAALRGLGVAAGFPMSVYESEYNTVHQTLLDERSELYSFAPEFVVFLTAVQALRNVLLSVEPAGRREAAVRQADELAGLVRRAAELPGATVVVHEFVLPYERPWGNFGEHVDGSLRNAVRSINAVLRRLADELSNVYTVDLDYVASWVGKRAWFDERLWFHSKNFCHHEALPTVAAQTMDIIRVVKGRAYKCVAVDLDNTLWGGTIGDDGLEGIRLGDLGDGEAYVQFQVWLRELGARGILLSVCSKNDLEKAREPFQKHSDMVLREDDITCFIANWDNKADNLHTLAKRLNIGLDSIVFLDDSPFERNLVRELVPEVCVPELPSDPAEFIPYLESLNLFEAAQFSDEDRRRRELYRANVLRDEQQGRFTNVGDYLVSLGMEAAFERFDDRRLARIAQLVQRTNQFNLTTVRHPAAELESFLDNANYFPFYITLADRFGDNGLISVVIGKRDDERLDIVTWLMSCRVISRRLEEFVLDQLVEVASGAGLAELQGTYVPTPKNTLVADHYEKLGFRLVEQRDGGTTIWRLDIENHVPSGAPIRKAVAA